MAGDDDVTGTEELTAPDPVAETVASLEAQAKDLEASAVEARVAADAAKAEAVAAAEAAELAKVDPAKHVFVNDGAGYTKVEFPTDSFVDPKSGACRERRLTLFGRNYEHIGDRTFTDANGVTGNVWVYGFRP